MAKLTAAQTKAIALEVANMHKTKKVIKKNLKPEDMDRNDTVSVKKVHVLMPSQGAFIDLNEDEENKLRDYAMEKDQSIHVFEHELDVKSKKD